VAGWLLQHTGEFFLVFVVAALVVLAGSCSYLFIVDRVEQIDWRKARG